MSVSLLVISLALLAYFVHNDAADYAAFKQLTSTLDRQRRYRVWVAKSFLVLFGLSLAGLALLHHLADLIRLPALFSPASQAIRARLPVHAFTRGFVLGVGLASVVGLLLGVLARSLRKGETKPAKPVALGDIESLLPRNWAEIAHTGALSINAGLSEEAFFRLFLPLVLMNLHLGWLAAFLIAALIFGLIDAYQGVLGVAATTVLGLVLTLIYLGSGSLLVAICVHIAIDLMSLVVRPAAGQLAKAHTTGSNEVE